MNHTFKTVWNAVRRTLVAVNETKMSVSGGTARTKGGSVSASSRRSWSVKAAALAVAMTMAGLANAAEDYTYTFNFDASGGQTEHKNMTVDKGVTFTFNDKYVVGGVEFGGDGSSLMTVQELLTNKGTVVGDAHWLVNGIVNEEGASFTSGLVTFDGTGLAFRLDNAGTAVIAQIEGSGPMRNSGSFTLQSDYELTDALTNTGKLDMKGLTVAQGGSVTNSTENGIANIESLILSGGNFTGDGTLTVTELLQIDANRVLEQAGLTASGTVTNNGTVSVTTFDANNAQVNNANGITAQNLHLVGSSLKNNNGTVKVLGNLTTDDASTIENSATIDTAGATVAVGGELTNTGSITGGSYTVSGTLNNSKTIEVESLTVNTGSNTGNIGVTGTFAVSSGGNYVNDAAESTVGQLSVVDATISGTLTNRGDFTAETATVSGNLHNSGTVRANKMTVEADGVATNEKSYTVGSLEIKTGGTFNNNDNNGQGTLTVEGTEATKIYGALINSGQVTVNGNKGLTVYTGGSVANSGTFTADGATLSGGSFGNTGSATFGDLAINAGSLTNAEQKEVSVTGKLTVNMANKVDVAVDNSGSISVDDIDLQQGKIRGGSVGSSNAVAKVGTNGVFDKVAGVFKQLIHAGESIFTNLTVDSMSDDSRFENTGTALVMGTAIVSGLDNRGDLSVQNGKFTGGSNDGTLTTLAGGDVTLADTFSNTGTVTANGDLTVDAGVVNSGTVDVKDTGSFTVGKYGFTNQAGGTVTVGGATTVNGTLTNNGTFTANGTTTVNGELNSTAQLNLNGETTVVENGKLIATGTLTSGNKLTVNGSMDADAFTVTNTYINNATSDIDDLVVSATGIATNNKTQNVDSLTVETDGRFENTENGVLTIAGANKPSDIAGSVTNTGTLDVQGTQGLIVSTGGNLVNDGTFTAAETAKVTVAGGTLTNNKTANLGNAEVTGGSIENANAQASLDVAGTLTVNVGESSDVAVNNAGTITFGDLQLTKGTITGGTVGDTDATASVGAQGIFDKVAGIFKTLTNAGKSVFTDLTVGTGFTNNGTTEITGKASVAGLDNQAGAQLTVAGGKLSGSNAGTLNTSADVTLENFTNNNVVDAEGKLTMVGGSNTNRITVGNHGEFVVGTGTTTNTGTIEVAGSATIDGVLKTENSFSVQGRTDINGELNATGSATLGQTFVNDGGKLTSGGTTSVSDLTMNAGSELTVNGGTLKVENLQAENTIYNQVAGAIDAVKGWFENSVLNISGGKLDAADIRDSEGNATGSLGNNTINISGNNPDFTINNDDPVDVKQQYKDNKTVVTVDTLTSETTVNVLGGGVLDVENIQLSKPGSVTLNGGIIQTGLNQIFDGVKSEVVSMDAINPETGKVEIGTSVLASTSVGGVHDTIKNGMTLTGGAFAFDDAYYSLSTITSAKDQLKNGFGQEVSSTVTLHFLGQMSSPVTIDTVKKLEEDGIGDDLNGIVLTTTTLHNITEESGNVNKDLVVGGERENANSININIGFQNVDNTQNIYIEGDKDFALVGKVDESEDAFKKDENKLLTDSTDGGKVEVSDGTFTMGSDGVDNPTVGWVNETIIGQDGELVVKNGEFGNWTVVNDGNVDIHNNAVVHINSYTGSGTGTNSGMLNIEDRDGKGATFEVTNEFVNSGTLDATDVDTTEITGTLTNTGDASYDNVHVADNGKLENSGTEKGNGIVIEGEHKNDGDSQWNSYEVVDGGKGSTGKDGSLTIGTEDNPGKFVVDGEYTNDGSS